MRGKELGAPFKPYFGLSGIMALHVSLSFSRDPQRPEAIERTPLQPNINFSAPLLIGSEISLYS
jgi:hypothetical protein